MDLDIALTQLRTAYSNYLDNKRSMQSDIVKKYPEQIRRIEGNIAAYKKDIALVESTKSAELAGMTIHGKTYDTRKDAGEALIEAVKKISIENSGTVIGNYRGFDMQVNFNNKTGSFVINLQGELSHKVEISNSPTGNITRLDNELNTLPVYLANNEQKLEDTQKQLETAPETVI